MFDTDSAEIQEANVPKPGDEDFIDQLQTKIEDRDLIHGPSRWKGKSKATDVAATMYFDGASAEDFRGFVAYCETECAQGDDNTKVDFAVEHLIGAPMLAWKHYERDRADTNVTWQDFLKVLEDALHTSKLDEPEITSSYSHESLTSFHNNGVLSTSASVVKPTEPYDLIDFLAVAQHRRIDMLPFIWDSKDLVGVGGTANVSHGCNVETSDGLQMSFVFKRVRRAIAGRSRHQDYQALLSEVHILGHPVVRHHPNIITLEGFCWETIDGESWPVLIFERTMYGDLGRFMRSEGMSLSFEARTKLCREIGDAIMLMHSCHLIHGDLKPENVLVFLNADGQYSAKVADFGYSTLFAEDSDSAEISLPMSWPWTAPEVEGHRRVTFAEAKSADIFSYGLVCLWLLSYETLLGNQIECGKPDRHDLNAIWSMKRREDIARFAHGAVLHNMGQNNIEQVLALMSHFDTSLSTDRKGRRLQVDSLGTPFGYPGEPLPLIDEYGISVSAIAASSFDLVGMFSQFRASGVTVWRSVLESLQKRAESYSQVDDNSRKLVAYQLAFCYEVGFATEIDKSLSTYWLEQSDKSQEDLNDAIEMIRDDMNPIFKNVTSKIDYFDKQKMPNKGSEENPGGSTTLDVDNGLPQTDAFLMGSTAAWIHKFLGINNTDVRMTVFENANKEEMEEKLRQLCKDQFGWKEGEYGTSYIKFTSDRSLSQEFPIETFMRADKSRAGQETTEDEENRLTQSLDRKKKVLGLYHGDTLRSMDALVSFYTGRGRWSEAEPLAVHVMDAQRETLGQPHPSTLNSMRKLAGLCLILENWKDGEALLLEILDTRRKVLGFKHPDSLVILQDLENLARQYAKDSKFGEARHIMERLLDFRIKAFGDDDDETLTMMQRLALLSVEENYQGSYARAEELLTKEIQQRKRLFGKDSQKLLEAMNLLVAVHLRHINEPGAEDKAHALGVEIRNAQARLSVANRPSSSRNDNSNSVIPDLDDHLKQHIDKERLDNAIQGFEDALKHLPDNLPEHSRIANELAQALVIRHRHCRDKSDLERALVLETQVLLTLPEDDLQRPQKLAGLSNLHWLYFETTSSLESLEASLETGLESVTLTADDDDSARFERIGNLASRLRDKYGKVGDVEALEMAIVWAEQMTQILKEPAKLSHWFVMLGFWYEEKYRISKNFEDISEAIDALGRALDDPFYASHRSQLYNKLSDLYHDRYLEHEKCPSDMDNAVEYSKQAAEAAQVPGGATLLGGETPYGPLLMDLAAKYFERSQELKSIEDLENAVSKIDLAAQIVPPESRHRQEVMRVHNLIHGTHAILGGTYDVYEDSDDSWEA